MSVVADGTCRASTGSTDSTLPGPRRRACMSSSRRGTAQEERAPKGAWPLGEPSSNRFSLYRDVLVNLWSGSHSMHRRKHPHMLCQKRFGTMLVHYVAWTCSVGADGVVCCALCSLAVACCCLVGEGVLLSPHHNHCLFGSYP